MNKISDEIIKAYGAQTEEEKAARWKSLAEDRTERWRELWREAKSAGVQAEIEALCVAEIQGGACPHCETKWREVTFKGVLGHAHYWEPACECYPKCPNCRRWLYEEMVTGSIFVYKSTNMKCPNCGWMLSINGVKRYGPQYEIEQFESDKRQALREKMYGNQAARKEDF